MADRVMWKTRIDERTCPMCKMLNNRVYYADRAPSLPVHDNCRCSLIKYKGPAATLKPKRTEHIGEAYWSVMFDKAQNLPEVVTNNQRLKFRQEIQSLVKSYPYSMIDMMNWMRNNKPEGESRDDYVDYVCQMKNFVNSQTGKPIYDCSSLTADLMAHNVPTHNQSCGKCNAQPSEEDSEREHNPKASGSSSEEGLLVTPDLMTTESEYEQQNGNQKPVGFKSQPSQSQTHQLYTAFKDYKSLSKRIVENLCNVYRIPVPEIIFDSCPDNSGKSCTVGNKTIYLDPNQYSARTLLHEFIHYHANVRGNRELDLDETKVDTLAQALIDKSFRNSGSQLGLPIRHDTFAALKPESQRHATNMIESLQTKFPLWSKALNYDPTTAVVMGPNGQPATAVYPPTQPGGAGTGIQPPQPVVIQDPKDDPSTGLMAMFDNVYTPFASLLGLKSRDINESHTPSIIQNAVTTLAEGNLSDLGALSVSLFSSIALLALGTLGKDHIVVGDRKLMAEMGAGFLWNSMRYVGNPKSMETINDDAKNLGEALGKWNTDQGVKIITTDRRDMRKTQQMKRMMESRRKFFGGGPIGGDGEGGDVIYSRSGPNGPTESPFSTDDLGMMGGMGGAPMIFTAEGGKPTRVLVGSDGKTLMKSIKPKENKGADIKGLIGTTMNENPYNRQSPFTFVGGSALGTGEPDRRPAKPKQYGTGEYLMDDLAGEFVPAEYEHYYRPQQEFPGVGIA